MSLRAIATVATSKAFALATSNKIGDEDQLSRGTKTQMLVPPNQYKRPHLGRGLEPVKFGKSAV